jgi:hypothetical protein
MRVMGISVGRQDHIIGLFAVLAGALIAGFVAPASSNAEPGSGCPEDYFPAPVTYKCERYFTPAPEYAPEYVGEDAFLAQSRTLFALSPDSDVLELGYSICRGIARGKSASDIKAMLVNGGIDKTSAVAVVINAQKMLCPPS